VWSGRAERVSAAEAEPRGCAKVFFSHHPFAPLTRDHEVFPDSRKPRLGKRKFPFRLRRIFSASTRMPPRLRSAGRGPSKLGLPAADSAASSASLLAASLGARQAWFTGFAFASLGEPSGGLCRSLITAYRLLPLSSRNAPSGDFPLGKPTDLRVLRARRRGALPLTSCQELAVSAPVWRLSSR